eukprot:3526420-Rhodomonas_salina.2
MDATYLRRLLGPNADLSIIDGIVGTALDVSGSQNYLDDKDVGSGSGAVTSESSGSESAGVSSDSDS